MTQLRKKQNVLSSVRGEYISNDMRESLAQFDVVVDDDTLIEVIPCGTNDDSTVLAITKQDGSLVTRSVFLKYGENGERGAFPELRGNASTRSVGFGSEIELTREDIVVRYSVLYNRYVSSARYCYQPIYAQIIFFNEGTHNVSRIGLSYECYGFECDYPSFQDRNEAYVLHEMIVDQRNPVKNRYYGSPNAYRTDRVICVNPGLGYHSVTYSMTLDGISDSWTDFIPLNQ